MSPIGDAAPSSPIEGIASRSPIEVASVYLHAPFCARRCFYCDFAVEVRKAPAAEPWLTALRHELEGVAREGRAELADVLETLYVGGGTPSLLGPDVMDGVAELLGRARLGDAALEWTAEANPESLTAAVATGWRRAGVNRLSLGTQSFDDRVLRWMGRLHGAAGAETAVATARDAGFASVSIDLIFGLPGVVPRDWTADLERALSLEVPHLSLYGLTAESGTPLGRAVAEARLELAGESRYEEEYLEAVERLVSAGYEHYEVSNFARPGHRSRHNQVYWSGRPYLGLGNGAHSFLPPERRWNVRSWTAYEARVAEELPLEDREVVEGAARRLEEVWLGLRTDEGLAIAGVPGGPLTRLVADWTAAGLVQVRGGRIVATARGWLVLDRLAVELDAVLEREDRGRGGSPTSGAG